MYSSRECVLQKTHANSNANWAVWALQLGTIAFVVPDLGVTVGVTWGVWGYWVCCVLGLLVEALSGFLEKSSLYSYEF